MAISLLGTGGGSGSASNTSSGTFISWFSGSNESNNMNNEINAAGGKGSPATKTSPSYLQQAGSLFQNSGDILQWILIAIVGLVVVQLFKD